MNFSECNLHESLLHGIEKSAYISPTPVQEAVLEKAKTGVDLYVQSQTGTGKTAGYLIPILQNLLSENNFQNNSVLILLPTRELAVQVEDETKKLTSETKITSFSFYGGVGYDAQKKAIANGCNIIIGTPGRIIDLCESNELDVSKIKFLVIDEADRMFDMGFYPDLRKLLKRVPNANERQTFLFSATLNSYVKNLAWEYTIDAEEITIESENITVSQIDQELLHVASDKKMQLLISILQNEKPESVLIFCNTKKECEIVAKRLSMNDFKSAFIIGDLPQVKRQKTLDEFKAGKTSILVATDVAARGIDVHDLQMVVNFDVPNEAENYVHRIGRTARAGKSGKAYMFCSEQDVYNLPAIERYIEMQIPSRVVDESLLAEDKSAGVFIRTGKYFENEKSRERKRNGEKKHAPKQKQTKRFTKKPTNEAAERETSFSNLQNLSFEERMKIYKEKYANQNFSVEKTNRDKKFSKQKKQNTKKNFQNRKHKNSFSKNQNTNVTMHSNKQGSYKNLQAKKNATTKRISIFSKIKNFFFKKNKDR